MMLALQRKGHRFPEEFDKKASAGEISPLFSL
jgi:hypothetical protein